MAQGAIKAVIATQFDDTGLKKAQKQFGDVGSSIKKVFGAAVIVGALREITQGVQAVVKSASDLSEVQAAVDQVFGNASSTLREYATTAASTMGISQTQFLEAAKTFGVFGKAAGLAEADNAQFATGLTQLASDLASFNNTSTADAISALGAGLRGESEPLRRYGVMLSDAVLKARAMEMGIYSGSGALTSQQKILASQAEIMAQTGTQQGDFARTSDGLANSTRILTATFEDMKGVVGQSVAPAMATLAQAITPVVTALGPVLNKVVGALNPIFEALPALIDAVLPPFMSLIELVGDLISGILPPLLEIFAALVPVLDPVISVMSTLVDAILPPLAKLISAVLVPVLKILVDIINEYLLPYVDSLSVALGETLTQAVDYIIAAFGVLMTVIEPVVQAFEDFEASTGIDFKQMLITLSPLMVALKGLSIILALAAFNAKLVQLALKGDFAGMAALQKEGPFAEMEKRAKAATAAAGQAAAAAREAGQAANFTTGTKSNTKTTFDIPSDLTGGDTKGDKAAKTKADKAAKARADALAQLKKTAEEAKKAFADLKTAADDLNKSLDETSKSFEATFKLTAQLGEFEQQATDAFDGIKKAAADAFDSKLIGKQALDSLNAYADREKALLVGIAKQRDVLAKKISIAQSVTSGVMGSLNITAMLESETKQVTKSVTRMVDGIALTTTQTFDEVVSGGLADSFKKLVDKTKAFAANLTQLKKLGLNGNLFKQIVEAGAESGNATAEAIIAGGASAVTELNGLFGELEKAGSDIAATSTPVLYALGEDITNSFIDGLRSEDQKLIDTATAMAALFTSEFKKSLNNAIAPTLATVGNTAMNAQKAVDLSSRPDPKRSPQSYKAWLEGIGGIDPVRSPQAYANQQNASMGNTYNVTVQAGIVANKQEIPAMIVDALGTYTKQSGAGGLTRILGIA